MTTGSASSTSWGVRAAIAVVLGSALILPAVTFSAEESQDTKKEDKDKKDATELEEVQVTGSRILRKDLESNSPTVTVTSEAFDNRANMAVEDVLNQLPQFASSLGYSADSARRNQQGNSSTQFGALVGNGDPLNSYNSGNTVGATNVSLRGLGANRTLLLLNGRRLVPVNASLAVDTSSIPSSALQRVEVVTGGASSVYGADAVSGVVNFILKDNYQGADLDVQYGIAEAGDNQNLRVSGLLGGNFADGRGNAFIGLEYSDRGVAYQSNRSIYKWQWSNPLIAAGGNTDLFAFEPSVVASTTTATASYYAPSQAAMDAIYGSLAPGAVSPSAEILVNPNGTIFVPSSANGATHAQLNDGYQYKINQLNGTWGENNVNARMSSPLTRYSMFASAHFDVNDNLRFYTQATFAQTHSESLSVPLPAEYDSAVAIPHGSDIAAATVGTSAYATALRASLGCAATGCTNSQAFPLPAQLAALLNSRPSTPATPASDPCLIPFGFSCPVPASPAINGANLPFGAYVPLSGMFPQAGTKSDALNFQLIDGFTGNLPVRDWTYDVYNSYGQSRSITTGINSVSLGALSTLLNLPNYGAGASVDGDVAPPSSSIYTHATIKCTSGLGPAMFPSLYPGQTVSQDCINSLLMKPTGVTTMRQEAAEGSIQGGLFELPAGDLRFALGAGWRTNTFDFDPPDAISSTNIFDRQVDQHPSVPNHSSDSVKEAFTELLVPVLRDVPFAKHLNLELGYRYSDYEHAGPVSTWKALADWALTPNFRFRGGFQRANRAPNLVELFDPGTSAVQIGPGDACTANSQPFLLSYRWSANPTGNAGGAAGAAKVKALCQQIMGTAAAQQYYVADATPFTHAFDEWFISVNSVGNPNLKNEKSDTWTVGAVLRSPFTHPLASFTTTVDWFKITVANAIYLPQLSTGSGSPLQACFDPALNAALAAGDYAAAAAVPACQLIPRNPQTGAVLSNQNVPYENVGGIVSEGVDFSFNWTASLTDFGTKIPGRISYSANASYMIRDARQSIPGYPYEDWSGVASYGAVRWSFTNAFGYFNGPFNASLNWRHYPSQTSPGEFLGTDLRQQGIEAYDILGLSVGYSLSRNLSLRAGVDNLLNRDPPLNGVDPGTPDATHPNGGPGSTGFSVGNIASGVYDVLGRSYFVGFKWSL